MLTHILEVVLNHVNVLFVVLVTYARIANNDDTELVEAESNFPALFKIALLVFLLLEEGLHLDDGRLLEREVIVQVHPLLLGFGG